MALIVSFVLNEIFPRSFDIMQNFLYQTFSNIFAWMDWYDSRSAVRVAKINMASFLPDFLKPEFFEDPNSLDGFKRSEAAQTATLIS